MSVEIDLVARFVRLSAWEIAWGLVPPAISVPVAIAKHFWEHFIAADPSQRNDLVNAARSLSDEQIARASDELSALISEERQQVGATSSATDIKQGVRTILLSLREAGDKPQAKDSAESVRLSLNRQLTSHGSAIVRKRLTDEQQQVASLRMTCLLSPRRDIAQRRASPVEANAPRIEGHRLTRRLAEGGFGAVYLAVHEATGEPRAVKIGPLTDVRRFHREAETLQAMAHPHVVRYFGHGEEDGKFWIAMEYLGNQTLSDLIAFSDPLPQPEAALLLAEQILRGLSAIHEKQIIHRDLKPANVVVGADHRLVLIDLGLAKPLGESDGLTATGDLHGTPEYMSPEQLLGKEITCASDIWSFGVVLHELLTGRKLFKGNNVIALSLAIINEECDIAHKSVPKEVLPFLEKCLAREASKRFASAVDAMAAFAPIKSRVCARLRHERFLPTWKPILEKRLIERFVCERDGILADDADAEFVAFAACHGVSTVDIVRIREVLRCVAEKQRDLRFRLEENAATTARIRHALSEQSASASPRSLGHLVAELEQLESRAAENQQTLSLFVRDVLSREVKEWAAVERDDLQQRIELIDTGSLGELRAALAKACAADATLSSAEAFAVQQESWIHIVEERIRLRAWAERAGVEFSPYRAAGIQGVLKRRLQAEEKKQGSRPCDSEEREEGLFRIKEMREMLSIAVRVSEWLETQRAAQQQAVERQADLEEAAHEDEMVNFFRERAMRLMKEARERKAREQGN